MGKSEGENKKSENEKENKKLKYFRKIFGT